MRPLLLVLLLAGCTAPYAVKSSPVSVGGADDPPSLRHLDRLVHAETNAARRRESLGQLGWSDDLARIARRHSQDMARRRYFDHVSPDGTTPRDRGAEGGVECRKAKGDGRYSVGISENLYYTTRYESIQERRAGTDVTRTVDWFSAEEIAEATVRSWLGSPDHRRNLLDRSFDEEGIGVALGAGDRVYITQVFC